MEDTCWIKDERGRFRGRRPGCKMEKGSSGMLRVSDSTADNTQRDVVESNLTDMDRRIREIMNKPASERTKEENEILNKFIHDKAAEISQPWKDGLLSASLAALLGANSAAAIATALASGVAVDEIMKYANEKFGKWGAIGLTLAAIILTAAKVKYDAKSAAKAEKKAAEAIAERKAATEAEKKAAEESAKTKEKLGKIYDETANNSALSKSDAEKEATKIKTGDIKAKGAKTLNEQAEKAGSSTRFDGYTTEATQDRIEHSMRGHSDAKVEIAKEREARGDKVSPMDKIPEEYVKGKGGKHNVPLTKEDYQKIEEYRNQAVNAKSPAEGRVVFQSKKGEKDFETVDFQVRRKDGVIHEIYKVDPVNKKLKFVTMYKETEKVPPAYR
ncbi:hypothetical protein [Candidatus Magnetominusculus xianensis]|uniref:Bacterial CdiA-CT RNAse A domain-containing protein n=1 Tax=Candidatus Magnetominusculus xianensis TaxID=1748249 RepID=A0ABR5SBD4_9BACT|nr:hypothetical protein [Candidatus Magnetominusculus xianensis]KWT76845.1 hypothetical protein ASN18_3111 [Candidatus Magnetominusculus xianensis]MBF0402649.1 hypothetical protein [Nitrospirota bacterium]